MPSEISIKVENLSKCYQIYDQPRDRLKQFVAPRLQRALGQPPRQYFREFWALKDVSFEVERSETVGIIGRNGSGKSTLLQMICGTLNPTGGSIQTQGRIAALLELGSGFKRRAVVAGRQSGLPVTVLGQATNVLIADRGLPGLVVLARNAEADVRDELLTCDAGAVLSPVVAGLADRGLAGLEFAGNIPGSVGGAVVGNAGAYGRAVGDALVTAELLVGEEVRTVTPADLRLELPHERAQAAAGRRPRQAASWPAPACCAPRSPSRPAPVRTCWRRSPATPRRGAASTRSNTPPAAATSATRAQTGRPRCSSSRPASRASASAWPR